MADQYFLQETAPIRNLIKNKRKTSEESEVHPSLIKSQIKLLTLNMFLRPVVNTNESDYKYERLDVLTNNCIEDFDIVCHQEVFEGLNSFKATLISKATEAGFTDFAIAKRPGFFDPHAIDGGLIILSKFPIIESDYIVYKNSSRDCILSSKGCVYAKIYAYGKYIHIFNTHLQASYYPTFEGYKDCINSRFYQCKELTEFVDLKTKTANQDDIIIVCGDFNICSNLLSPVLIKHFTDLSHTDEGFEVFSDPNFDSLKEYKTMMNILSNKDKFKVTDLKDLLADEKGGPPTFGAVEIDQDGIKFPVETVLLGELDLMTEQSLDYIFLFERKSQTSLLNTIEEQKDLIDIDEKEVDFVQLRGSFKSSNELKLQTKSSKINVCKESIKIEKFPVTGHKFAFISDHFGVSVKINIS